MKLIQSLVLASALTFSATTATAAEYMIDTKGMHAFVQFKIQHLGVSWLHGRFNDFSGSFSYDAENPGASKASVVIKTASLDTNHAERDKHLRSDDFFDVDKYPEIRFESTRYDADGADGGTLHGNLTMHGRTKPAAIVITKIGEGTDPWGGYRAGFDGSFELSRSEFGIDKDLGPASEEVGVTLSIEGVRK
ncbi:conserved hypothetical protein [gamma proteobacterium NOR5-3]|nr:conserved hypothetical protein [gamma proteobacterium NOR5-3]